MHWTRSNPYKSSLEVRVSLTLHCTLHVWMSWMHICFGSRPSTNPSPRSNSQHWIRGTQRNHSGTLPVSLRHTLVVWLLFCTEHNSSGPWSSMDAEKIQDLLDVHCNTVNSQDVKLTCILRVGCLTDYMTLLLHGGCASMYSAVVAPVCLRMCREGCSQSWLPANCNTANA